MLLKLPLLIAAAVRAFMRGYFWEVLRKKSLVFKLNSCIQNKDMIINPAPKPVLWTWIILPQSILPVINITKYFQIQFGAQTAFLLNAKVDSSSGSSTGNASLDKAMEFYNRFDYGFAGGVEIHPVSGLLIGARINISFSSLYKDFSSGASGTSGTPPSFVPKVDVKNNLFQIFAGWKFGGNKKKKRRKRKINNIH